jgi:hypothetical protein
VRALLTTGLLCAALLGGRDFFCGGVEVVEAARAVVPREPVLEGAQLVHWNLRRSTDLNMRYRSMCVALCTLQL